MSQQASKINKLIGKSIADRYRIINMIGQGGMGMVFRAMPFDDPSQDVAIKIILRDRQINSEDLLRFQKEAALMSRLHHPNIICFHELGLLTEQSSDLGPGYYIVMEIANGANLKQTLEKEGRKDLNYFFELGIKVAEALDYTHGKNIIHRDIKPQNIIVGRELHGGPGTLSVKVLDFGVASLFEVMHDGSNQRHKQDIAGTPLYMAPEQTPLMNAEIDHRVDLYSLGCVLYETLTGRPPFTASSRDKLERDHVYSRPESLSSLRPDLPPIITDIVHRLLAKHPSERYQSAFSLKADLIRARARLEKRERPTAVLFPLASNDRFESVAAKIKMVGRETELSALEKAYETMVAEKGRSRLTVVKGIAGSGKTRLFSEFKSYLNKRKIRFVSVNFSQHENSLPFNALANGFNDYLTKLIKQSPYEADELRRKIRTLIGPVAWQLAEVVPGLKPYLSDLAPREDGVDDQGDFISFAKAFSDFTRCLSMDLHPIVFIFDDLHWADQKSIELIDQFFSHNNSQRFFLLIGYRSNDPVIAPQFSSFLEKFSKLRRRYEEVELTNLPVGATKALVQSILQSDIEPDQELINYIVERTAGIPLNIIEVMRTLVAEDHIRISTKENKWQYDVEEIRNANIRFNSVDLVLARLLDYDGYDRTILEAAAVAGMSFQFEFLLLAEKVDSRHVLSALERSIQEGLLVRSPDESDFVYFGKTFSFAHWRARDLIYRNIDKERRKSLHAQIALKLSKHQHASAKFIFTLAHHLNSASLGKKAATVELARLSISANMSAGQEALKAKSWQSAQRYFENAAAQVEFWKNEMPLGREDAEITEHLGDLAALQRRFSEAMSYYKSMHSKTLDSATKAAISYKSIKIQLTAGHISDSIHATQKALREFNLETPKSNWWLSLVTYFDYTRDTLTFNYSSSRLFRLLNMARRKLKKVKPNDERKYFATRLYELAVVALRQQKPKLIAHAQFLELKLAQANFASAPAIIRMVAERAADLGRKGYYRLSYALLDASMELSRRHSLRSLYGYICLLRIVYLDYIRDRDDEIKVNLRAAMRYISPDEDRIWYATALEFSLFHDLMKGKLSAISTTSATIPHFIQTRHWSSARAMAIVFYSWMLADTRDLLVNNAQLYLQRRSQVAARDNDPFIFVIKTMLAYAKGEVDKVRSYYRESISLFLKTSSLTLMPFEEDFICFFALTFPPLFEQEHRNQLLPVSQMQQVLLKLEQRIATKERSHRGLSILMKARIADVLGKSSVKKLYDHALKSAKLTDSHLLLIYSYLWFGDYLINKGAKFRNEYLRRAHEHAASMRLNAVVEYCEKSMEQRNVAFRKATALNIKAKQKRHSAYRSNLVFEHIEHVSAIMHLDTALEQHIEESLAILGRYYLTGRVVCLANNENNQSIRAIFPYNLHDEDAIRDYVLPYANIRSSLFLPLSDAPWVTAVDARKAQSFDQSVKTNVQRPLPKSGDPEETAVIGAMQYDFQDQGVQEYTQANLQALTPHHGGEHVIQRSLQMSAIVPIRYHEQTLGLLLLEDIDLTNKDTTAARRELDVFGAQLGLIMAKKGQHTNSSASRRHYQTQHLIDYAAGVHVLENVQWLKLWSYGRLRAGRDSGWYMGVNMGSEHYMLMYCRFNGPQAVRERLSMILWHQMLAFRTLYFSSGRADVMTSEIHDEIAAHLGAFPTVKELEHLTVAYTLFDRHRKTASSGHFGPARPIVLCQPNSITPDNRVVLSLQNGRDVRYWNVESSMQGPHIYILTHDSSKLEVQPNETQRLSIMTGLQGTQSDIDLHTLVEQLIIKENMPRYYVGAILPTEEHHNLHETSEQTPDRAG